MPNTEDDLIAEGPILTVVHEALYDGEWEPVQSYFHGCPADGEHVRQRQSPFTDADLLMFENFYHQLRDSGRLARKVKGRWLAVPRDEELRVARDAGGA